MLLQYFLQRMYEMNSFFENYANFSGRTSQKDYVYALIWGYVPALVLICLSPLINDYSHYIGLLSAGISLFLFIPSYAAGVRRLHDIGQSGWLICVPLAFFFILFFRSDAATNHYGPPTTKEQLASSSSSASALLSKKNARDNFSSKDRFKR